MRIHGSVSLALLAIAAPLLAQDLAVPRPLESVERQTIPELTPFPTPTGPRLPVDSDGGLTTLESEIEALRADLQSFHALSSEVARSARAADAEADRTLLRQRQEMLDILTKLATQGLTRRPTRNPADVKASNGAEPVHAPPADSTIVPEVTDAAVDQFALGKVLFRAGEFAKAEQAFRKVAVTDDNRLMVKYLIATCLRKRSRWQEAMESYREVAASDTDPVLRDLAKFQLDGIRWNQETENQIEQLRKQREFK
jgi:tetratricopeptide (TPR) repeat protein